MFKDTPEQLAIFDAAENTSQNLFVEALAGTGKTTTIERMLKRMPLQATLCVAFNVKNKNEFEKRFPDHITAMTLNGLGHRAWKQACNKPIKLDDKKLGRLLSQHLGKAKARGDTDEFMSILRLISLTMQQGLIPSKFTNYKGLIPDTLETWKQINSLNFLDLNEEAILIAHSTLEASIAESFSGTISYDDQIYMSALFNGHFPKFPLVIVDEAQDLSPLNHIQIRKSALSRLIIVGDTRQAIYQFRGADSASMEKLRALRPSETWTTLHLSTTFRCPKCVVERQLEHAPLYVAAPTNPEGAIQRLPDEWNGATLFDHLPHNAASIAVLCRNNAPLLSLAFKLIRQGIGINMLGRDIGKSLVALAKKILGKAAQDGEPIAASDCVEKINEWRNSESSKAMLNNQEEKLAGIEDRAECLLAVLEGHNCKDSVDLFEGIQAIFEQSGRVTLSTGHRAKGLEWDLVLHLDPWRIPSKYAIQAAAQGATAQLEQEKNLKYVIETRTKHTLALGSLSKFQD